MQRHQLRLAFQTELLLREATSGWASGFPTEEAALLNRITERIAARSLCDVGDWLVGPAVVRTDVIPLHRKGPGHSDLYGSDLALTLFDTNTGRVKSALLQLKRAERTSVELKRSQLEAARLLPGGFARAFVVAANQSDQRLYVRSFASALASFRAAAETHRSRLNGWLPSYDWLLGWIACTIATDTASDRGAAFERLLADSAPGIMPHLPFDIARDSDQRGRPERRPPLVWIVVSVSGANNVGAGQHAAP